MAKEMTPKLTYEQFNRIMDEANFEAAQAARAWLVAAEARGPLYSVHEHPIGGVQGPPIDYMLDLCGGAMILFCDKRDHFYKHCEKLARKHCEELGRKFWSGPNTVDVNYSLRGRQEMGLHEAAKKAALAVFQKHGIKNLRYHSYID